MTIGTAGNRASFNCDGVTKVFPLNLQAYLASDFTVALTAPVSAGGGQATLVLNSDYSLATSSTDSPPKWTLTTLAANAYLAGYSLQAFVNPSQVQQTSYVQGQAFPSLAMQTNLDRLTQMVQRLEDQVSRAVRAPDGDVNPLLLLPPAGQRALMNLTTDANGNIALSQTVPSGTLSAASIGGFLYPQSAGEAAAGVVPVNIFLPVGYLDRYGTNTTPGTTDMTTATQNWMKAGIAKGGELTYGPGPYLLTSGINCTFAGAGACPPVSVRNLASGHNANANATGFVLAHASIGFDCTGNDTIQFIDPCIKTQTSPPPPLIPICAILFARNTTGASLINRVIRPKIVGYFSAACVYNYGSEDFVIENGYLANYNTAANTSCFTCTAFNIAGLTSIVGGLIASGSRSTTAIDVINMTLLQAGGTTTSDCVRIEGVSGYHQFGGWMDADTGRAGIYVDQTNTTCQDVRLLNLRTEHTGTPMKYGILWGAAGVVRISTGWSISGCRLESSVNCIAAVDANTTLDGITIDPVSEQSSLGLSIPGTIQGFSNLRVGGMVLNIGALINVMIMGLPGNWTIGTKTTSMLLSMSAQQVAGFGTPVGAAIIANYNITDAGGANSNTNKCVAEILTVLKANGLIAT